MFACLERLRRKSDFYAHGPDWVRQLWTTEASFDWYVKSRKAGLQSAGGLRRMGRDWFVDLEGFTRIVAAEFNLPTEQEPAK